MQGVAADEDRQHEHPEANSAQVASHVKFATALSRASLRRLPPINRDLSMQLDHDFLQEGSETVLSGADS